MDAKAWLYILALWLLFFWLYRDYRLDAFRQKLFAIRDDLFDLARSDKLCFRSKAYGMLRSAINGNIRFGHRLGFLDFLCFWFFLRGARSFDEAAVRYQASWQNAVDELTPEAREKIENLQMRLHFRTGEQIIFTSAILMFTLVTFFGWVLFLSLKTMVTKGMVRVFRGPGVRKVLNLYDCAAALNSL